MTDYTPFEQDSLMLHFPSPLMRVDVGAALPNGSLDRLADAIMASWRDHLDEQSALGPATAATRRATDQNDFPMRARTEQEQNEEFFYYQKRTLGVTEHASEPAPDGWLASEAAQELLGAVTAAASGYLERVAHHAGLDVGRPWTVDEWELDPDRWHVWASVHHGGSTHPSHVHMGAAVSAVFYVRMPPGSGQICFFDPRGARLRH
jgi:hypothetical protein